MKEIAIEDIVQFFKEAGVDEIINDYSSPFKTKEKLSLVENLKPLDKVSIAEEEAYNLAVKANTLEDLQNYVMDFDGCPLKATANKTVFADGSAKADVMIIGEAPGANEDIEGVPFCGQSGKLLDQIFDSINLIRSENLYIANAIFWRPPGNRKPTNKELAICRPLVEKHIALIAPKLIVACGSSALASLFPDMNAPITKIRGEMLDYQNQFLKEQIKVMPIFHPSFLLRQPSRKRSAWEDMLKINSFIN
jgi:uracil-DNA glycosylase